MDTDRGTNQRNDGSGDGEEAEVPVPTTSTDDIGPAAVGRVDWSPLAKITGTRPLISRYGVPRYSALEWREKNQSLYGAVPSVDSLEHESKNVLSNIAADIDKQQMENTQRIRQRAADIYSFHDTAHRYSKDIKAELELLAQCKLRIRKALENVNVVDGINRECREIRKNRLTEDLVRDVVEEELFQEYGLCQEVRELYRSAMTEFDTQFNALKKVSVEIQAVWSDQREALELETENISLNDKSPHISYCQGIARLEPEMSSTETWENFTRDTLANVKTTLENSRDFRRKISSPVIEDSARDLTAQGEKVTKAFIKRIEETENALHEMEYELEKTLKEIAHCEQLYLELEILGRQIDYNLKVVQTRLDNRRRRPGVENCRDKAQYGLMNEIKTVCQRVTAIQQQLQKLNDTITNLYALRKSLERHIHVKRHTLSIDQRRYATKSDANTVAKRKKSEEVWILTKSAASVSNGFVANKKVWHLT